MDRNVIYIAPGLEAFAAAKGDTDGLTFEKELIYCGTFEKDGMKFTVTPNELHHWSASHKKFLANGIDVPLPIEHTENPEANRGSVIETTVRRNKRGILALYGKCQFRDAEAAKLALTANCSIYVPHRTKDGAGREYIRPITHVALTDYPVVTGLEKFQPIAASFSTDNTMATAPAGTNPSLMSLAEKFAIPVAGKDDGTLQKDLDTLFTQMKDDNTRFLALLKENDIDPASKPATTDPNAADPNAADPAAVAASRVNKDLLLENRRTKLEKRRDSGHLLPTAFDKAVKTYCSEEALSLSLKSSVAQQSFNDFIATIDANEPVISFRQQTAAQATSLSNPRKPGEKSPLDKAVAARVGDAK